MLCGETSIYSLHYKTIGLRAAGRPMQCVCADAAARFRFDSLLTVLLYCTAHADTARNNHDLRRTRARCGESERARWGAHRKATHTYAAWPTHRLTRLENTRCRVLRSRSFSHIGRGSEGAPRRDSLVAPVVEVSPVAGLRAFEVTAGDAERVAGAREGGKKKRTQH